MSTIEIRNLTKDYGDNRGIFDINLDINQGEMVGFVGTNGSGKTTTIRNIMGFIKPTSGSVKVDGLEAWTHSSEYVKNIGYVPGEIAFPDLPTGIDFLKSQANFLGLKDLSYANELIEKLQLDPRANLKRMSKGMKQKTALVAALMNDPKIIILDEPTTGLDPIERLRLKNLLRNLSKDKIIIISTHIIQDMDHLAKSLIFFKNGQLLDFKSPQELILSLKQFFYETIVSKKDLQKYIETYHVSSIVPINDDYIIHLLS